MEDINSAENEVAEDSCEVAEDSCEVEEHSREVEEHSCGVDHSSASDVITKGMVWDSNCCQPRGG